MRLLMSMALALFMFAGVAGSAAPALAWKNEPPTREKCNSGNGNGSETEPATDCDPSNSGGHNNGGD
ncbi:MAG: hypothetical protein FJ035_06765 [Chloroflexi bacterium]|nr:hypothetical protein [Chloroflexota bacterium]